MRRVQSRKGSACACTPVAGLGSVTRKVESRVSQSWRERLISSCSFWTSDRRDLAARIAAPNRVYLPVLETSLVFENHCEKWRSAMGLRCSGRSRSSQRCIAVLVPSLLIPMSHQHQHPGLNDRRAPLPGSLLTQPLWACPAWTPAWPAPSTDWEVHSPTPGTTPPWTQVSRGLVPSGTIFQPARSFWSDVRRNFDGAHCPLPT
jgi:hypothetical protein